MKQSEWMVPEARYIGVYILIVALVLLSFCAIQTPACEEKPAPPADKIQVTRTADDDVTIDVQGPTAYLLRDFLLFERENFWPWNRDNGIQDAYVDITSRDGESRVQYHLRSIRSLTLSHVVCQVRKREPRRLISNVAIFTLVKGPDAEPGEKLSVKGTFMWNIKDGEEYFFHEEGGQRIWKTFHPKGNPKEK